MLKFLGQNVHIDAKTILAGFVIKCKEEYLKI
jgi:hypothetical protein